MTPELVYELCLLEGRVWRSTAVIVLFAVLLGGNITFESHFSTPIFLFTCGISGCTQTYISYSSISAHVRRKHASFEATQQDLVDATILERNSPMEILADEELSPVETQTDDIEKITCCLHSVIPHSCF